MRSRGAAALVVLACLLAGDAPRHADAAGCQTLSEARSSENGYPRYRLRGGRKCWYGAGGSSSRRHARRARPPVEAGFDPNPHGDPSWQNPVTGDSLRYLIDDAFNQIGERQDRK